MLPRFARLRAKLLPTKSAPVSAPFQPLLERVAFAQLSAAAASSASPLKGTWPETNCSLSQIGPGATSWVCEVCGTHDTGRAGQFPRSGLLGELPAYTANPHFGQISGQRHR